MRLVTLANGPFAVPMLRALCASAHDVARVVIRPPRMGRGRHRHPPPSPMQQAATELGIEVLAPTTVNAENVRQQLLSFEPDLFVVCDYGEILRAETLAVGRCDWINLHGSLLPKYRGAAPVAWAIYHGESETGNTVFQVTSGVDAGPILGQRRLAIDPDETAGDLEARLAEQGASLVIDVIDQIAAGTVRPVEQETARASKAPRLKKADGQIDWSRSAAAIRNQVRALQPWPRAFTAWQPPRGEPLRLILTKAVACDRSEPAAASACSPGTVLEADTRLIVAAGDGAVEIVELQPAGKRAMVAADFLRGQKIQPGECFS